MLYSRVIETDIVATSNLYVMKTTGAFHTHTPEAVFCTCWILRLSLPIARSSSAGVWEFLTCEAHTPFKLLSSTSSIAHLALCKGFATESVVLYSGDVEPSSQYEIYMVSMSVDDDQNLVPHSDSSMKVLSALFFFTAELEVDRVFFHKFSRLAS